MAKSKALNKLELLIKSDQFCSGQVSVVAYNTAWVARIKDSNGNCVFPECLEWVRHHQLKDGSWGSNYPGLIFEKIISTLICIICLKQWGLKKDTTPIEKGFKFISENLILVHQLENMQDYMTIGFELILPVLIDEAKTMGLEFGQEQIVKIYRDERNRKINRIIECERSGKNLAGINSWWFTLEGLGQMYSNEQIIEMVSENGLICDSYGATAYMLFKGINSETSHNHISEVITENHGGIPSLYEVEIFDLVWSINTLIFAGYNIKNDTLAKHIDNLEKNWINNKGMLGGSVNLPPDADIISSSILALISTGKLSGIENLETLMKYFRNNHFITYQTEGAPSLSTNINCLITLKKFQNDPTINDIIEKLIYWIKTRIIESEYKFMDKWNVSSFYSMSRALIAFNCIDDEFCEVIYQIILNKQNQNGGWGSLGRSTYLETSYVVIALNYRLIRLIKLKNNETIEILKRASKFMYEYENEQITLWTDKALYSPINLDKTTILAAQFVLEQLFN